MHRGRCTSITRDSPFWRYWVAHAKGQYCLSTRRNGSNQKCRQHILCPVLYLSLCLARNPLYRGPSRRDKARAPLLSVLLRLLPRSQSDLSFPTCSLQVCGAFGVVCAYYVGWTRLQKSATTACGEGRERMGGARSACLAVLIGRAGTVEGTLEVQVLGAARTMYVQQSSEQHCVGGTAPGRARGGCAEAHRSHALSATTTTPRSRPGRC